MALSWTTLREIPRLNTYADASEREAKTKPVRGDGNKCKPLGKRNQKYRYIKRMPDNSIGIFDGWSANGLPRIQFFENGDIHITAEGSWNKAASNEVITKVTGAQVHTEGSKAWIRYDGGTAPLREAPRARWVGGGKGWVQPTEKAEPSVFRRNEGGRLVYINPPEIHTHVVSRKGAKTVRTRYMGALGYVEALCKLRKGDTPKWEEIEQAFPDRFDPSLSLWQNNARLPEVHGSAFDRSNAIEIAALLNSEELGDHYRAYLWLQRGSGTHGQTMANADKALAWVHRDEWFTAREAVVGQKVHDRHTWAFRG
jgi:hypothetical protein